MAAANGTAGTFAAAAEFIEMAFFASSQSMWTGAAVGDGSASMLLLFYYLMRAVKMAIMDLAQITLILTLMAGSGSLVFFSLPSAPEAAASLVGNFTSASVPWST